VTLRQGLPLLPTRRLAAGVAAAGIAFVLGTTFALLLNALLLVLVAVEAVALYRLPLPRLVRSAPARVPLGETVAVQVELANDAAADRRVAWTDDPGAGLQHDGADTFEAVLPSRGSVIQGYRLRGTARGRTALGDMHFRVCGPLELLWRRGRVTAQDEIVVQPGLRELHRHRLLALQQRTGAGSRSVRELGDGREFERLQEYTRGDDPRHLDWKATARRGQLIVRKYEAERSQSIMLAIDAGRLMMERFDGRERLDHALAAALVIADVARVFGDAVGVLLFADRVQAFLPPARHPLGRVADVLASVEARRVEPDYPAVFHYMGRQLRRRSLVVLFTDVIDARASAALLEHLAVHARRHLPLIAALRNVELDAAAMATVTDEAGAFRRAAAEELLQARTVALAAVRRHGVLVADVRPDAATAETLSRYLDVKRRGLL
jgi:uncharacterized protein (DUF58 family)